MWRAVATTLSALAARCPCGARDLRGESPSVSGAGAEEGGWRPPPYARCGFSRDANLRVDMLLESRSLWVRAVEGSALVLQRLGNATEPQLALWSRALMGVELAPGGAVPPGHGRSPQMDNTVVPNSGLRPVESATTLPLKVAALAASCTFVRGSSVGAAASRVHGRLVRVPGRERRVPGRER